MTAFLEQRLKQRKIQGNLRQLPKTNSALIDFASNDYLGLARNFLSGEHSGGSTGSRLLTGNSLYAETLEHKIATFHRYEAALLFNCGYMANLSLISTIAGKNTRIVYDAHIHASTHDGIRISQSNGLPFRHNDLRHLEQRLKVGHSPCFVCVESVYSTDGSRAPLTEICDLAAHYGAYVIVDEAHAVGAYGPDGRGHVAELSLTDRVFAQVVTFGKALGAQGAAILGSKTLIQGLINFANAFIYTTALPSCTLAAINRSYDLLPTMEKERKHLRKLISLFGGESKTAIQSFRIPCNASVRQKADQLAILGFDVRALTSPTVRRGEERLRICLHAFNTVEEVASLKEKLK